MCRKTAETEAEAVSGTVVRKHMVFSGLVQGVGFRWRARHAAEAFGVTGWVRNEADGSVTMELQGPEEQLARVLESLERGVYIRVETCSSFGIPVIPGERGFVTRDDAW